MKHTVTITAFRPFRRGTLCGFAIVHIRELHLVISDVAVHRHAGGAHWVQLPAKPLLDHDGAVRRTGDGKVEYVKILNFDSRAVADAFSAATIGALLEAYPTAFDEFRGVSTAGADCDQTTAPDGISANCNGKEKA